MAHLDYPTAPLPTPSIASGRAAAVYRGARRLPAVVDGQQDHRIVTLTTGRISDQVLYRATPTAPEAPFANGRVWLLRLADGYKAWEGWSDAQGHYTATGLEAGVEYVAVGIDPCRNYKATGAGPVVAPAA